MCTLKNKTHKPTSKMDQVKLQNGQRQQIINRTNPISATQNLFEHLVSGKVATWSVQVQVMPESDGFKYKWNIFDVTKVWPHADYPCINFGNMVINRNPENYFQEVEQSAFSLGHLVPGIEPSLIKCYKEDCSHIQTHIDIDQEPITHNYQSIVHTELESSINREIDHNHPITKAIDLIMNQNPTNLQKLSQNRRQVNIE